MINKDMLAALGHDVVIYGMRILVVLVAMLVGWQLAGLARRTTLGALERGGIDLTIGRFVANLARVALLALMISGALGALGVETTAFSAAIAGGSVAIGLSFRDTLANVAAGFMLLAFRPFRVGDIVNVAGTTGRVFEIDLFLTKIDSLDNRRIVIPNGTVFRANIENYTHHRERRIDVTLLVTSNSPEIVRAVLEGAMRAHALPAPAPAARLVRVAASSEWSLQFWATVADHDEVKHRTLASVTASLAAAGIPVA